MTIACQNRTVSDRNSVVSKPSRCQNFLIFGLSIQESMWPKEIPKNDLEAGSNRDKGRSTPPCVIQGGSALGNNRWGPCLLHSPHAAGETRLSPASSYSTLSSHSLGTFRVNPRPPCSQRTPGDGWGKHSTFVTALLAVNEQCGILILPSLGNVVHVSLSKKGRTALWESTSYFWVNWAQWTT